MNLSIDISKLSQFEKEAIVKRAKEIDGNAIMQLNDIVSEKAK